MLGCEMIAVFIFENDSVVGVRILLAWMLRFTVLTISVQGNRAGYKHSPLTP